MNNPQSAIRNGIFILACLLPSLVSAAAPPQDRVDFNRDIRPILSENCFTCHGFDAGRRQAGLRLDVPEGAYGKLASGKVPIAPHNLASSELIERITTQSAALMPPAPSGKSLKPDQILLLKRWIQEGAPYAAHWAFVAPVRPAIPAVKNKNWPRNSIDHFILARLEKEGLQPSPEADRRTLIRRVTQDLTGLPPTPEEVDAFLTDKAPEAYEKVVDRLLDSPRYGERMALAWLDLARYADTHGYHMDSQRDMWRWRDWVIDAFNRNLPYDQFTIQQLAGDLLPSPTLDQKIATGFNRNHPITYEGGAIPEEYAAAYIFDRIDTTATTWMGLTMRCAQCHDHKYDPITQKEFYQFYAFFNNVPEQGLDGRDGNAMPFIKAPTPPQQQQQEEYGKKIAEMEEKVKARTAEAGPAEAVWEKTAASAPAPLPKESLLAYFSLDEMTGDKVRAGDLSQLSEAAHPANTQAIGAIKGKPMWGQGKVGGALSLDGSTYVELPHLANFERGDSFSYGAWVNPAGAEAMCVFSQMDDASAFRGWDIFLNEGKVYAHLIHEWPVNAIRVNTKAPLEMNKWTHIFVTYDGTSKAKGIKIYLNGKPAELEVTHDTLTDTVQTPVPFLIGKRSTSSPFHGLVDEIRVYKRELASAEVEQLAGTDSVQAILALAAEKRTKEQKESLVSYYLQSQDEPFRKLTVELTDWRKKSADLDASIPTSMVMQEMEKPRDTFILVRGQYDKKGDKVTPDIPAVLPSLPAGAPRNRLSLAHWLVGPSHPLTARVAVNRYWEMHFGSGIVKTVENFGLQGDRPTHPELLDWLATEFIRTGWDVKGMQRLIVTSATYRQSSRVTPVLLEKDPENRLLARAPRFRMPAEFVRDGALAVSGLLVEKRGGPSVKPYQPAGLWEELASGAAGFTAQKYEQDHGESLYRRSMYTFWKRTCPPPSLQTFDAPEREFCMVRRSVTNTPLQALVLMNDPTYTEAARKFAERMMTEGGLSPYDHIRYAFLMALSRPPTSQEIKVLMTIFNQQGIRFRHDPAAAAKLLAVGESPHNEKLDPVELAAWSTVASVILNLDETITRG